MCGIKLCSWSIYPYKHGRGKNLNQDFDWNTEWSETGLKENRNTTITSNWNKNLLVNHKYTKQSAICNQTWCKQKNKTWAHLVFQSNRCEVRNQEVMTYAQPNVVNVLCLKNSASLCNIKLSLGISWRTTRRKKIKIHNISSYWCQQTILGKSILPPYHVILFSLFITDTLDLTPFHIRQKSKVNTISRFRIMFFNILRRGWDLGPMRKVFSHPMNYPSLTMLFL